MSDRPKSPFPGMDPYLEDSWGDVHTCLVTFGRDHLQDQMPEGLKARIEEYISVQFVEGDDVHLKPDVRVVEFGARQRETASSAAAVAEPVTVERIPEPDTLRAIRVVDTRKGGEVVTTIEFLSPSNKTYEGALAFRRKQSILIDGGVNVVEVDLLRAGHFALSAPYDRLPASHRAPYRACTVIAVKPSLANVYHFSLRQRLPAIDVPLREGDPPARLDLQALVDRAYEAGDYDDVDYTRDPVPPLEPDDAAWADELLKAKGLR
jgi:hypothetical protein